MRRLLRTSVGALLIIGVAALAGSAEAQGRIIIVNGNLPGVGFNDPTPAAPIGGNPGTTLGEQRANVFLFAADIWTQILRPSVDVYVWARFVPLGANVLGSAGPISVSMGFQGAEFPDLWYHAALANHLQGFDSTPHDPTFQPNAQDASNPSDEISARFSTNFPFYFGLDDNEESVPGTNDLLVVVLHEIGHGLGFSNLVNEVDGTQFMGSGDLYSQYTIDDSTGKIWNAMVDAERMASALNIRRVSWSGVNVNKDVPAVLIPGEPTVKVNQPAALGNLLVGPASFGALYGTPAVTGDVVLGDDGLADPSTSNGCTPLVNAVAGKIVLLDRGVCTFVVKVKNAQDAGAIAVLIADNAAGSPPSGLGGADATITIPSGRLTLADGNTVKANLAAGVNVSLEVDTSILAGTDRLRHLMLLATFDPVLPGSSISHYDGIAFKNQLMEPAINNDLTSAVTAPADLTASLFTDIGWHSDRDGVPDGVDQCIGSDTRPTVVIDSCDTRAGNDVLVDGCTLSDELIKCELAFEHQPLRYLGCVTPKAARWTFQRIVTPREAVRIVDCALRSLSHH